MIICERCGKKEEDTYLHLHHIIPKSIGGADTDGRRYLCKMHHDILHFMMTKWIWNYVPDSQKGACREEIKKKTDSWLLNQIKK